MTPMTKKQTVGQNKNDKTINFQDHSDLEPVACRGGANGATAPGIQGRGHPKSEIIKKFKYCE